MTNHLIWLRVLSDQNTPWYPRSVPSLFPISPCSNAFQRSKQRWLLVQRHSGHFTVFFMGISGAHPPNATPWNKALNEAGLISRHNGGFHNPLIRSGDFLWKKSHGIWDDQNILLRYNDPRYMWKGLYQQLTVSPSSSRRSSQICWSASKVWQLLGQIVMLSKLGYVGVGCQ